VATGSGLDAQFGFKAETTWGTAVTVDKFLEFNSESLNMEPTFLEPTGLRPGVKHKRASRVRISRRSVSGDVEMEVVTQGMGTIWKHILASGTGSTPVQMASTTAYQQIHTPGGFVGFGLTMQIGRPQPVDGVVKPFTYAGCKVSSWEFALSDSEVPTLTLTVDGRQEATATALATASYTAGATVFDFSQATLELGGTASTASGLTTVASGTAVATIIREIHISGETPMANERFGLGNAGLKAEQLENDTPTITGTLSAEFNKAERYDVFTAGTAQPLVLRLEGEEVDGGNLNTLEFLMPAVIFKQAQPQVDGPDIVAMDVDFEAYSNGTDPVIQIMVISADTAL
jgi:hypothetical protein